MNALIRIFNNIPGKEPTDHRREVPTLQYARGLAKKAIRTYPGFRHVSSIIFIDDVKIVTISMENGEWVCEYEPGHNPH